MECLTVLKGTGSTKADVQYQLHDMELQRIEPGRLSRPRSRVRKQNFAIALLFVLLTILFVLLMIQHLDIQMLRDKDKAREAQIEELSATASEHEWQILAKHSRQDDGSTFFDVSKRSARRRRRSVSAPNFYVNGKGVEGGTFIWERPISTNFAVASSEDESNDGRYMKRLTITRSGVYFLYTQITLNGRKLQNGNSLDHSRTYTTRGVTLRKKDGRSNIESPLHTSYITQDERGDDYNGDDRPIDSVSASGLFYLNCNDVIFVTKPENLYNDPNGEQYKLNDPAFSQFGGFLVERGRNADITCN